ncbi:MAG TPA: bifunctional hydroxymethylpyrimidine kinase/phosphomethylpyrimidine kinase [Thermoanaerobaculia bacterium]|jgi:hydroxymethylpyrimidine/phosphomethylpyrimidine kinase
MAGRARDPVTVLSIASSDSGGGAGIQADLLTFAAHGVHGATAIVAGTAQNTRRVAAVEPFSPRFLARQIDAVFSDLAPRAVKIGMLYDAARIRAVAAALKRWKARPVVLDPVLVSKSGARLLSRAGAVELKKRLLPLCDLVTPNLPEAEALTGLRVRDELDRRLAAGILADLGARAVLIKDGHGRGREVRDLLFDGEAFTVFAAPRLKTRATHGTGCTLASAIAANLALGRSLEVAVERAIAYLRAGLERGRFPGGGFGIPGHFPPERPLGRA